MTDKVQGQMFINDHNIIYTGNYIQCEVDRGKMFGYIFKYYIC